MPEQTQEIFVVDDEPTALDGVALVLAKYYRVRKFTSAEPALAAVKASPPDLILLDIGLPGISGLEALERIKAEHPQVMVVMITAYEDVKTVVSAMKGGAYDYVVKPLNMEGLLVTVANALKTLTLEREVHGLQEKILKENSPCFIGASEAMIEVMDVVDKVAKSPDTPILISGETGAGKELIAQSIHSRSPRAKGPLVTLNCAAIPRELIESELFGYEKGAFSGAETSGKTGLVERADQGTLFLDEVADLSPEAQAKVLRFLESGEYYRLGGSKPRRVTTRVISASNRNLEEMVEQKLFRSDLYFRLAVVRIEAPSLNQRPEDIIPIAQHYLKLFTEKFACPAKALSKEAHLALEGHNWKGNVRELRNIIERAVLLADGNEITADDLALNPRPGSGSEGLAPVLPPLSEAGLDLPGLLKNIEQSYFEQALEASSGNEAGAARLLGLTRDAFRYRRHSGR